MSNDIKYVAVTKITCGNCGVNHTTFLTEEKMAASLKDASFNNDDMVFEVKREMSVETKPAKQTLF